MLTPELGFGQKHYLRSMFMELRLTWRPTNALNLSLAPSYSRNQNEMQYVTTANANGEARYVVGRIDQNTVRMVIRATYMLTPNLSFQYY